MNNSRRTERGFGLVEALVGSAILTVVLLSLINYLFTAKQASRQTETSTQVDYLLEEGMETLKLFRDMGYTNNILKMPTSTQRYFAWNNSSSTWATTTIDDLIDDTYERKYTLTDVKRDGNHDITTSGGTYDPDTRLATVSISWLSGASGSGLLTPLSPAKIQTGPNFNGAGVVVSPDSKFVYSINITNNVVYGFSRNTTTGVLTALSPAYISIGSAANPNGMVMSPDGTSVYIVSRGVYPGWPAPPPVEAPGILTWFTRNVNTGALTLAGTYSQGTVPHPFSIVISPDGLYVYTLDSRALVIYRYIRNADGSLSSPVSVAENGNCAAGFAISPDGTSVYVGSTCGGNDFFAYTRNVSTGLLTFQSVIALPSGAGQNHEGIAVSPDGAFVYLPCATTANVAMYSRDLATGVLTPLSPGTVAAQSHPSKIAISPDGFFAYVTNYGDNTISQYSRNITTGILTPLSPSTVNGGSVPQEIALSPDGGSVYAVPYYDYNLYQYSRNPGMTTRTIQAYITNIFSN
jgi:6-phosphogluconolactonase